MAPVLGYWDIRGLGEPIRMLHVLLALPLEEKLYADPRAWVHDRALLETPFANLPYYTDSSGTYCETGAILAHVCRAHGTPLSQETRTCQQAFFFLLSCHEVLRTACYGYVPQSATRASKARTGKTGSLHLAGPLDVPAYRDVLRDQLAQCAALCDPFMHGSEPGVCDVLLYTFAEMARSVGLDADAEPVVGSFVKTFRAERKVAEYLSTRAPKWLHAPFVEFNMVV